MIDTIYKTLLTILNKENQGYVTPTEFNLLANNVQSEIFRGYFEDYNRDLNREARGLTNKGYANLAHNQRQLIQQFASTVNGQPVLSGGVCNLPDDIYFVEDNGIVTGATSPFPFRVVDEVERGKSSYLNNALNKPSNLYPVFEHFSQNEIIVTPDTVGSVNIKYLRKPAMPNWTYFMLGNNPVFNPADIAFQDFELHETEFSNIVLRMLSYFGLTLREAEVINVAEAMKDKNNAKENN